MTGGSTCLAPHDLVDPILFNIPALACDTHAHVIAADCASYPMVANRSYTPPPAPESKYLAMQDALGMQRGVLVQVSVYGNDNRCMLDVLSRHPQCLRGIAVVDATVTDQELLSMHEAGIRGLRINVLFRGGVGFDLLETLAARIAPLGWHMQLLMDVRELPGLIPRMRKLPCPCVVDHMGHMPAELGVQNAGFQALLRMVADCGWWVKLSGAYRLGCTNYPYPAATDLARQLVEFAPDRLVWGSDWPHVSVSKMPDTGALLNLLPVWVPEVDIRKRILVDNPARLYGF